MNSSVLYDAMPFVPVKFHGSFKGTFHFHLQGEKVSLPRNIVGPK
jgi:hypothetical protein